MTNIFKGLAAALSTALLLSLASCEEEETYTVPRLAITINPVTYEAGSQHLTVSATNDWSISLSYSGDQSDWAEVSPSSGDETNGDVRFSYSANDSESARTVTIRVVSGNLHSDYVFSQGGKHAPVVVPDVPVKAPHWMELPAMDENDGMDFFSRSMEVGTTKTRNYSFYWNYDDRVSMWVAYPLNKWNIGSYYGRSEEWGYDPLLPAGSQQNVSGGYREGNNGWYSRGHQIPSADRQGSRENNATTFYGTNMTPQNNDFNGGLWAKLEEAVRGWAGRCDTLYVLTGCVTEGSKYYVFDRSGNEITVPTGYFKAMLRYQKNSTIGTAGYIGAAFYFDHEEYSRSGKATAALNKSMSMPLKKLEEKLGYELFVNLPDAAGGETNAEKIKSQDPSTVSWWW